MVNISFLFVLFCQKSSVKCSVFSEIIPLLGTNKRNREGVKWQNAFFVCISLLHTDALRTQVRLKIIITS
jgi:hypothetical protein